MNRLLGALLAATVCLAALCCFLAPAMAGELPQSPDDLVVVEAGDRAFNGARQSPLTIEVAGFILPLGDPGLDGPDGPEGPEGPSGPGGGGSGGGGSGSGGGGTGYGKPPQTGDEISALFWIAIAVLLGCMFLVVFALVNNDRNTNIHIVRGRKRKYP